MTVVIPALGDIALIGRALPGLFEEFDARGLGDELVLVDDTGRGELSKRVDTLFGGRSDARVLETKKNGGFAAALEAGVRAARFELVFSMNSDVIVRLGFLGPLVAAVKGSDFFSAAPRVLLNGAEDKVESFTRVSLKGGLMGFRDGETQSTPKDVTPIPFAVGGTCLFKRARFLELGGFDPLFAPFYFEDVDLCWRAWRRGWQTIFVPDSTVEHHHMGTIGKLISPLRQRAAVERGELLFNWKHLPDEALGDHLALLFRRALDGYLADDRQELIWLALALEKSAEARSSRLDSAESCSSFDVLKQFGG